MAVLLEYQEEVQSPAGVVYVMRGHKNPKLVLDRNEFVINHKGANKTRWRCTSYYKTKCVVYMIRGRYKNSKLVFDRNEFEVNNKGAIKTRWRCTSYYKTRCMCYLITQPGEVTVVKVHNHAPTVEDGQYSDVCSEIFVLPGPKNPKILVDGHDFHCKYQTMRRTLWWCCSRRRTLCRAKVVTYGRVMEIINSHNHEPKRHMERHYEIIAQKMTFRKMYRRDKK
ncbi:hypothetical protein TcasGA2_TC011445 [Tribolium castaneum]|uniref:FLYWCH-type domain-containing protein n=1 Tax=Tribolium castaneum TaxID=7070 RepID=D6X4N5_TRICA|nr:hypothetical protein TcasGA2_TC011445 [Tribolium castaneum]